MHRYTFSSPSFRSPTGTHLLTAIIDASWKVNAYYNGVFMRRGDCYVCVIHFLCPRTVSHVLLSYHKTKSSLQNQRPL